MEEPIFRKSMEFTLREQSSKSAAPSRLHTLLYLHTHLDNWLELERKAKSALRRTLLDATSQQNPYKLVQDHGISKAGGGEKARVQNFRNKN
jgi:hypothetical protein